MDSTIEKEGNSLPHNTTEEVGKILQSFVEQFPHDKLGYYPEHDLPSRHHPETGECISCPIQGSYTEDIYWFMEKKLKEYGDYRHNLALSQVLEKIEEEIKLYDNASRIEDKTGISNAYLTTYNKVKSIITSLQKE